MVSVSIAVSERLLLLGAAVRVARHERGWTQAELATRTGTGVVTIIKIEGGSPGVAFGTILQVCLILNLSPDPVQNAPTASQQRALNTIAGRRKRVRKPLSDPDLDV